MKSSYLEIVLADEIFYLLPQKAVYRPSKKQLILADVHLGKATHFRKEGIAMPAQSYLKDIDKLNFLLNNWKPASVLILGDLFHSSLNNEWRWFKSLLMEHDKVQFILAEGNHDILKKDAYALNNLLKVKFIAENNFTFSHEPLPLPDKINFCGHIHPGIKMEGMAKQTIKLPCFYFNGTHFILPAFGELTGLHLLKQEKTSDYYLITPRGVIKLV